ncbi:hypothetical protein JK364_44865 [Streptomyces sp. 110]|uniref:Glyoxalase-like domain-containing protein n=1 Tax=Streptomyces endocoffeicus TaxID=2898945 RepID=A0ABS1Q434_9ACTN|nr:hypothetical protein [Streptomyces endocoffeicus]MBL1119436.1 hypothetical protein [Streptomyces endocoffeicus]
MKRKAMGRCEAAGAQVLWGPYDGKGRSNAMVRFPGGYVAEPRQSSDL